jgi:transposase
MDGSDLTDDEWAQIEPVIPPAKRGGNNRTVNLREIACRRAGCQWRSVPKDGTHDRIHLDTEPVAHCFRRDVDACTVEETDDRWIALLSCDSLRFRRGLRTSDFPALDPGLQAGQVEVDNGRGVKRQELAEGKPAHH